jgi:hypothetical protein
MRTIIKGICSVTPAAWWRTKLKLFFVHVLNLKPFNVICRYLTRTGDCKHNYSKLALKSILTKVGHSKQDLLWILCLVSEYKYLLYIYIYYIFIFIWTCFRNVALLKSQLLYNFRKNTLVCLLYKIYWMLCVFGWQFLLFACTTCKCKAIPLQAWTGP